MIAVPYGSAVPLWGKEEDWGWEEEPGHGKWDPAFPTANSRVRCASFTEISAPPGMGAGGEDGPAGPGQQRKAWMPCASSQRRAPNRHRAHSVWETHNCTDSVETALKISSSTALRSSSVPKWIQQLRTHKLQSPARSTCPVASAQNLPSFLRQLCKGVQFHKESQQTPQMPFGFIWQDHSGARFFHPVLYLWIERYCSTPGQIPSPSILRNHHCFSLSLSSFIKFTQPSSTFLLEPPSLQQRNKYDDEILFFHISELRGSRDLKTNLINFNLLYISSYLQFHLSFQLYCYKLNNVSKYIADYLY